HVLGAGVAALGEEGGLDAHARGPGVDGVLHVGELAGGDGAGGEGAAGADADRLDHLVGGQAEDASGGDGGGEGGEGGVVPAVLADAGDPELAEAHLDFIRDHGGE